MKAKKFKIIFSVVLLFHIISLYSRTLTVKQDGTGDYTTVQAAVDAANNGDTVLVWPGTYYENVVITQKNITLGSLVLTTGDNSYISQTVIDGNKSGSCLELRNISENFEINGFTICNGTGSYDGYFDGGGIFLNMCCAVNVKNCVVKNNTVPGYGGGIYLFYSGVYLSGTTITGNHAYKRGGGITLLRNSTATFDTVNRCNIYENYSAIGTDIYKFGNCPPMDFHVDTFTVQNPGYYYVYSSDLINEDPQYDITFDILHHKIEQSSTNLYVSETGDNNNSGLTPEDPLKTISYALLKMASDSVSPDTIKVSNGTYTPALGEKFPLSLKSYVSIKGESRDSTVIDAEDTMYIMYGINFTHNYKISRMTLTNGNGNDYGGCINLAMNYNSVFEDLLLTHSKGSVIGTTSIRQSPNVYFKNVVFKDNIGAKSFRSGANSIYPGFSDTVYLINCKFIHNYPDYNVPGMAAGGAATVVCEDEYPDSAVQVLINCLIAGNHAKGDGGASTYTAFYGGTSYMSNCTFADNGRDGQSGADIGLYYAGKITVYNSIMYGNRPPGILMFNHPSMLPNYLSIDYTLFEGGHENIQVLTGNNILYYGPSNIDADPLFYGGEEFPYNLSGQSPCIDAGTMDLPQFILDNMPDTDLAGNPRIFNGKIDMGAYEWNPTVGTEEHNTSILPDAALRLKIFPNPFSSGTTVSVENKKPSRVKLSVYNSSGLLVKVLQEGVQLTGVSRTLWDGSGDNGRPLPPGIYTVVLNIDGKERQSAKVIKE